jgi:hypothetical protein
MRHFFLLSGFILSSFFSFSRDPVLIIGSTPSSLSQYQILIPVGPSVSIGKAAMELQKYLHLMTSVNIPVKTASGTLASQSFCIGIPDHEPSGNSTGHMDPDGFTIRVVGSQIYIFGGDHKGALYGVYELLEHYLGCRFFAPGSEYVPISDSLHIPILNVTNKPAFRSRETYYTDMEDPDFADKMRCNIHAWKGQGDWGMWVHTMFSLVPPDKYFKDHPEYYALMGGKRSKTQLCLSNPDVLKVTIEELKKKMQEKPGARYWSVSQMDTYGYCECDQCKAIYEREGSPSGAVLEFVNKVAAAFPDKMISTLAYQYTRSAPKHVKPASNVNIMLCTIECDRNKSIASDTSKGSFFNDLRDWSKIANDILVWDYVIQFTNMIGPFPNLHVLQPNIQLFEKYHVSSVFEQGCHGTYSENQELREYLLAKLLWDPNLDVDSLATVFLNGYYGAAGYWIGNYLKTMEKNLISSGQPLWIYGSPVQETNSFLSPDQVKLYDSFFDKAEEAVKNDTIILKRVYKARLPLMYAKIEISRAKITGPEGFLTGDCPMQNPKQVFQDNLQLFTSRSNLFNVITIHERGLSPKDYQRLVDSCCLRSYSCHIAIGKPYTLTNPPASQYQAEGQGSLTDGKRGFDNFHFLWQGFEGKNFEMVIDLGKKEKINYLDAGFLQDITSWIFFPEYVQYSISEDGKKFTNVIRVNNSEVSHDPKPLVRDFSGSFRVRKARYVKVFAKSLLTCPEWHIGHGGKAWLFIDEVVVDKNRVTIAQRHQSP